MTTHAEITGALLVALRDIMDLIEDGELISSSVESARLVYPALDAARRAIDLAEGRT